MVIIVPIVAIAALASLAMGRMYTRRDPEPPAADLSAQNEFDARVARVAQAVDVIGAELQRISEDQRTLTKVLAEQKPADRRISGA